MVQVDGAGFDPANNGVKFGTADATAVNAAPNRLTLTTPAGAVGAVDVTIRTPGGSYVIPGGFTFA